MRKIRLTFFGALALFFSAQALGQVQSCPANLNFSSGDISNWSAETGLVAGATKTYPAPNAGLNTIPEYSISTTGVSVITSSYNDKYGAFPVIPTINGYSYGYSIKIGSDATSWDLHTNSRNPGGFTRSVTYTVNVPAGPASEPYTMTYAYAMVLENGTHNSNEQPLFKATVKAPTGIVTCASPSYYLPTLNDGVSQDGGAATNATLDSAQAIANGFSVSPVLFLSHAGNNQGNTNGVWLQDVWTKSWTEVTFDLSPYRGQVVTLSFESDNCSPGAHFAYAYVALRNDCGGLQISGNPETCGNTPTTFSVPSLTGGSYSWTIPAGWSVNSGANSNIISVTPGTNGGIITARALNGCADLRDTITVDVKPPTIAGNVFNNNTVCAGTNSTALTLSGERGNILNWIASTDGVSWSAIANTTHNYTAQNLTTTTEYRAIVQNGSGCKIDTSAAALIMVDPKSEGGILSPDESSFCLNQSVNATLTLTGAVGTVTNWQSSFDNTTWNGFAPANNTDVHSISSLNRTMYYRTIVKSGVCPPDTSSVSVVRFINTPFPAASISPAVSSICYGKTAQLNATITIGTSYTWTPANTLTNQGSGTINSLPYTINAIASPGQSTNYVLSVVNAGCPNALKDTFQVAVTQPIIVFAGNDTSIVANQPLQLNATVNDSLANQFTWTPSSGLDDATIPNPIASLNAFAGRSVTYIVRATKANGCYGEDNIKVTVFTTLPDIFVPSGFSPNGDGRNDIIKPICVGISRLDYFRIYNRWGQLIFSTSEMGKGWDGLINGAPQSTTSFVYIAQGVDYTGRTISRKGTITLIR